MAELNVPPPVEKCYLKQISLAKVLSTSKICYEVWHTGTENPFGSCIYVSLRLVLRFILMSSLNFAVFCVGSGKPNNEYRMFLLFFPIFVLAAILCR